MSYRPLTSMFKWHFPLINVNYFPNKVGTFLLGQHQKVRNLRPKLRVRLTCPWPFVVRCYPSVMNPTTSFLAQLMYILFQIYHPRPVQARILDGQQGAFLVHCETSTTMRQDLHIIKTFCEVFGAL